MSARRRRAESGCGLTELLFDGELAAALFVFGDALLTKSFLLRPELFLKDALLSREPALLQPNLLLRHLNTPPLLRCAALLGPEFGAQAA
jgi:hypothetical protein